MVLSDTEKLHLHKFFSNNKKVINITPKDDYSYGSPDLDLALRENKTEGSLGVQWCIVSGKFQFNVFSPEVAEIRPIPTVLILRLEVMEH